MTREALIACMHHVVRMEEGKEAFDEQPFDAEAVEQDAAESDTDLEDSESVQVLLMSRVLHNSRKPMQTVLNPVFELSWLPNNVRSNHYVLPKCLSLAGGWP